MPDLLTNQGSGTVTTGGLTAPTSGTSESWTVTAANAFPAVASARNTTFKFLDPALSGEIMMATATPGGTGAGQAWTVTRGAEGTTPVIHSAGFAIQELITAGTLAAALGSIQAIKSGSSPAAAESWTNVTPPSGWSGVCRYKLVAEANMAVVDFQLTHAGASGNVTAMTLPQAFNPATGHQFALAITSNTAPANSNQRATVNNGTPPTVTTFALPASTTGIFATYIYPLD